MIKCRLSGSNVNRASAGVFSYCVFPDLYVEMEADFHARVPVVICKDKERSVSVVEVNLSFSNVPCSTCTML